MLEDIRRQLEGWLGETEFAAVRNTDPVALAARFPKALSADSEQAAEDAVTAAEARGNPGLLQRHRALRAGIVWARFRFEEREGLAEAEDRLGRSAAKLPDGASAGWSALCQMRDRAPVRAARAAGERAMAEAAAAVADGRVEMARRRHEEAQRRGAKDVRGVFERFEGIELSKVAADARRFLEATRDAYRENLDWLLKRHDASLESAEAHDIDWARHEFRRTLPAPRDRMSKILEGALKWMGLDATAHGKLHRGAAAAPPCVVARRKVPGEVHFLLHLEDGVPAWAEALGEWGRALAAAWTPATLPMEHRVLGDPSVPLAWAALLALAPLERDWISRVLDFAKSKDAAREIQTLHLAATRHLAGLLEAEIDLATGSTTSEAAELLTSATLARFQPGLLLETASAWFATAHRLRAAAAAASLANLLESRFETWHRNVETGKFLVAAWNLGRQYGLAELLEKLGAEADTFGAMSKRFLERLA
ncbi:MAG: hypothetical protein AAB074_22850 [Planctomycetota bacterium]